MHGDPSRLESATRFQTLIAEYYVKLVVLSTCSLAELAPHYTSEDVSVVVSSPADSPNPVEANLEGAAAALLPAAVQVRGAFYVTSPPRTPSKASGLSFTPPIFSGFRPKNKLLITVNYAKLVQVL